ncbi:MAG: isoleucine--tRNA ligase [Firmicutes bacterium]|nr:isoleucine--tRNA ligase [Bacillota bacterium]
MYEKVDTNLDFAARELEILKFWKENRIFEKCLTLREGGEKFTFYDGPPTANGKPHIGHVITRAFKDLVPRYRTMKGFDVLRKAGWDTHGLPVEREVEKSLGMSGKPDIEKYGIEQFNGRCKESVWKYEAEWREMSDRVGFWADMDDPYVTYHNTYIESEWWALKKIWDMGLIYKGHKVVPYCPRCGTPLSSHEVGQGYKNVKETSVFAKFKVKNRENDYLLAWTTTPWTLPSNVALAVNPDVEYARVQSGGCVYILAAALADGVLLEKSETLETFPGTALAGLEYENLFGFYESDKKCCFVVCDSYVTLTDGSGIVHIAPAFGEDDYRIGKKNGLPVVQLVDTQGNFTPEVGPWAGMFVKAADPLIIRNMAETEKLYKTVDYEHDYPYCWRCDTPLIYYARDAWFIEMTKKRDELIRNNNSVNWMPDTIRTGRMGNFLENVIDWSLSRERYWGTPLPVWECLDCGKRLAVGSVAELKSLSFDAPDEIELHRPYIDAVHLRCECGGTMSRVPEVIDCWFDSGSMPFAQWHYPFENENIFNSRFPADFISESLDQTRGWFYVLQAISTLVFDCSPYKNVIVTGLIQDRDGKKMSKSKGNAVEPMDIIASQGADAVRWYYYTVGAPWLSSRFYEEVVAEGRRKYMGTLWNTYAFYTLYAEIDQFDPTKHTPDRASLSTMDRWILSRLHTLIKTVDARLENYEVTEAARAMNAFADELSNWYVRRCRGRFWAGGMEKDKVAAYMTLYGALVAMAKLTAPFTPFLAESIYRNIVSNVDPNAPESVHFTDFPAFDQSLIDAGLEREMDDVLKIVVLGRAARNEAGIKNRQPIGDMYVCAPDMAAPLSGEAAAIVADELNVKNLEFIADAERFTAYSFKPQLRALGPKYGKLVPKIGEALRAVDGNAFMAELRKGEAVLTVEGQSVVLTADDVLTETGRMENYYLASDRGVTVVLSAALTPELIEEGFVREIISKLQTMRKEADFNVTDRIRVYYGGSGKIAGVIQANGGEIAEDVLADALISGNPPEGAGYVKEWSVNGEDVVFGVSVAE